MIRRRVQLPPGEAEFWLITQDDHARVSGELAAAFGNELYAPPAQGERTVLGVGMHDAGWPLHDDRPDLNDDGLPLDVFETPIELGTTVREASAARAEEADPYAGLLVSIHVQRLVAREDAPPKRLGNRDRFLLTRFRNDQAQRQMRLRQALGLRIDRPLDQGLPLPGDASAASDWREQHLAFDVRLLAAMDMLSLCICCTEPPTREIGPLPLGPGRESAPVRVERPAPARVTVDPWPFGPESFVLSVPYRPVPARRYGSTAELREALSAAPRWSFDVTLSSRQPPAGL